MEAVWEVRFSSERKAVVQLLPGLIFQAMEASSPAVDRLPASNLPAAVLEEDVALRYLPTVGIRLDGGQYSILIGEHVVSLSCHRPYPDWQNFEPRILKLAALLESTKLLGVLERFSLKYIDMIP